MTRRDDEYEEYQTGNAQHVSLEGALAEQWGQRRGVIV